MHVKKKFVIYQQNFVRFLSFYNISRLVFLLYLIIVTLEFICDPGIAGFNL